jgi:hypothetical protein
VFEKFMKRRFRQERSPSYIQEWAKRFKQPEGPRRAMDHESTEWYIITLEEEAYN